MTHKKQWRDLSGRRKVWLTLVGAAQITLTVSAYRDLAKRPAKEVEGPKLAWALAILVNWIGPIAYFTKGRRA